MAVEKNAVREGTRWSFMGEGVQVVEVTASHVIYDGLCFGTKPQVVTLQRFLDCAHDPATADHERFLKLFRDGEHAGLGEPVSAALAYLLERLGPPAPANSVPAPEPVKAAPIVEVEPASVATPDDCGMPAEPVAEYLVEAEPMPVADPYTKPRRKRDDGWMR